jgi:hypothetical protein
MPVATLPRLACFLFALTMLFIGANTSLVANGSGRQYIISLSIRDAANRGFHDQVAGDGRGGWTDQGPDNDLASLRPGVLTASGVTFEIIDPAQNGGCSAIVLGRASQQVASDAGEAARESTDTRGGISESAAVKIDGGPAYRFLYLLHAAANPPKTPGVVLGTITAHYADGSKTHHEIKNKTDIDNWRDPASAENAGIAWESENATASIGLYVSRFRVDEKPLASVEFSQAGGAAWMIVALSASRQPIDVGVVPKDFIIEPGPDWAPYQHSLDIEKGGVFDFSSTLRAPAGKFGAIRATPAGHFEFEERPGERVRFWGVNLCFSAQYLDKKDADLLAERLARSGYNTVRFHHFDGGVVRKGGLSWELDAAQLDKLDYLFAALKKRGIYINIDLYASRGFSAEECASWGFPGGKSRDLFKAILPVNNGAFESWARFAKNLLTHKNPHTGLTWAEEPALIGICPVNENPLFNRIEGDPKIFALYKEAFEKAGLPGKPGTSNPAFNQFIHELNRQSDARLFAYLRSLGTKALLTGANYTIAQGLAAVRAEYDYVDCHSYWDHPKFPVKSWAAPFAFGQGSSVKARAKMPNRIMPVRIFGRPFVSTEFNFCRPNQYRFEGAVLMPAYASLQDWDALYNFQYAKDDRMAIHGGVDNYFAIATDPVGLIANRTGSLVFQRFDIAPAKHAIAYAVNPDEAFTSLGRLFPGEFSPLGLVARIGSLPDRPSGVLTKFGAAQNLDAVVTGETRQELPPKAYLMGDDLAAGLERDGVIPAGSISADRARYAADTGEIELRADTGTVKAVSPRSELFVLAPGSRLDGACVSVVNGGTRCSISVIALATKADAAPPALADARRILVTHLTNALPQGAKFSHTDYKLLKYWGAGPHLVQRGSATLTLRLPDGGWRAWAVDATGKRAHEIPLARQAVGAFILEVSTITSHGTQLAYELAR